MEQSCNNCRFWKLTQSNGQQPQKNIGSCRRSPPVIIQPFVDHLIKSREVGHELEITAIASGDIFAWNFPAMVATDWCGEWRPPNYISGEVQAWIDALVDARDRERNNPHG